MTPSLPPWLLLLLLLPPPSLASIGDQLPDFQTCLTLCISSNCPPSSPPTPIPLHLRLLLWTCPRECDHTCQHIITSRRTSSRLPTVQFHGKWPFHRLLGLQEPFSVLFSLGNLYAHARGLAKLRALLPSRYPLRPYYFAFSYLGIAAWISSAAFHSRDFPATEQLDYFAAAATVLYGLYYSLVRVARLDRQPRLLRAWTAVCCACYLAHVAYLKGVRWDYGYNMAANVVVGLIHNALWTGFSYVRYRESRRTWATWPGIAVAWVMFAMSMELFDFPPWWGCIDAHSLWHLMTIAPTILWYNFLVKDANDDIAAGHRLKA